MSVFGLYMIVSLIVWGYLIASGELESEFAILVVLISMFIFATAIVAHCAVLTALKSAF
jgi:hypothetical protein